LTHPPSQGTFLLNLPLYRPTICIVAWHTFSRSSVR
jgi:hypothetical protein